MRHDRITGEATRSFDALPSAHWLAAELSRTSHLLSSQMKLVERYRSLHERAMAAAGIGIWEYDLTEDRMTWTQGVYDLFGLTPDALTDRNAAAAQYDPASREEMERLRAEAIATGKGFSLEACIRTPAGKERWMHLTAHVDMHNGKAIRLFGVKQDITEQKRLLTRMQHLATTDPLTRLGNRTLFQFAFHDQPDWEAREIPVGALVLIDLDDFKDINDRYGHLAGDACLSAVARRLSENFSDASLIARIGGDEFAILLPAPLSHDAVIRRMHCLKRVAGAPVIWKDQFLPIGLSAGVAIPSNPEYFDADALFQQADAALYEAKQDQGELFRMAPLCATPCIPPSTDPRPSRTCEI